MPFSFWQNYSNSFATVGLLNKIQEFPEMLYNVNDGFVQYDLQLKDSIDK